MDCPNCGAEMRITGSVVNVENDKTPDAQTYVYQVQQLRCMNPRCPNPATHEQRHQIYPEIAAEPAPPGEQTSDTLPTEPTVE